MSEALPEDVKSAADAEGASPALPVRPSSSVDPGDPVARQQAMVAMGRRALASPDLSILLEDAARLIAETLGTEHYVVAELSPDGSKIHQKLALESPGESDPRVVTRKLGAGGTDSLVGHALEVAHPVTVGELGKEARFCDPLLREHGIRSAIAVPLKLRNQSFGALAACSGGFRHFLQEDVMFAETVAHLITTTVARIRTESRLAEQRRLSAGVLHGVGAIVLLLDAKGQIVTVNRACQQLTGFSPTEIENRPIWEVFPVPDEANLFPTIFKELRDGVSPVRYESYLLTRQAGRRQIAWAYAAMRAYDGSIESVVATGIDVTGQREAEEKAQRAEQAVEEAHQAMNRLLHGPSEPDEAESPSIGGDSAATDGGKHKAAKRPAITVNRDRRRRPRRRYPYRQLVAPVLNGILPAEDQFVELECYDISSGGFSFWSLSPPPSESLVVALGTAPQLTHLTAQIAHVTRGDHNGKRMYLIGCNYVGRVAD